MLYIRMLLILAVSLYTSRVVLQVLGVEDFGIFNVVGGVIAMLGFLNSSLSGASSRFIAFALGEGDMERLRRIFANVSTLHLLLAGAVVLVGETAGLWFVCHELVIPPERMTAALWVYHCSVLTAAVTIVSVPYNALIIAHERMAAFAYISVLETVLRLVIVWVLIYFGTDKLIVYALLYLAVQLLVRCVYGIYCSAHFEESRTRLMWDGSLAKTLVGYACWTMNGNLAIVGYTQGINILLNLFFGPVVNAARGIAVQVQAATSTFVQNFQMAVRPQIIKSYAVGDMSYMHALVVASSKYGFFLMSLLVCPILLCTEAILRLWLGCVPEYTVGFVRIMALTGLLEPFKVALTNAIHATGDIRKFQIYEGTSLLLVVPIAYALLKFWQVSPQVVMAVYFGVEFFTQGIRIWIVLPKIAMSYRFYFSKILIPLLLLVPCLFAPLLLWGDSGALSFGELFLRVSLAGVYMAVCIFLLGLRTAERRRILEFLKSGLQRNV